MCCKQIQETKAVNEELEELTAIVGFGSAPENTGPTVTFAGNSVFPASSRAQLYFKKNVKCTQSNAKLPPCLGPVRGQNNVNAHITFTSYWGNVYYSENYSMVKARGVFTKYAYALAAADARGEEKFPTCHGSTLRRKEEGRCVVGRCVVCKEPPGETFLY